MIKREEGLVEVEDRLRPLFGSYPLKFFKRNPARTVTQVDMPCVLILEGEDDIIKRSSRSYLGYPLKRVLQVNVEVWDLEDGDVKALRNQAVELLFASGGVLVEGVVLNEIRTIGPFNLGIPDILGMRIVCGMTYKDEGPF